MAVAALAIVLVSLPSSLVQLVILIAVLVALHPRILNPILKRLAQAKLKQANQLESDPLPDNAQIPQLQQYPWRPLLGEVAFVDLRGVGFVFGFMALYSLDVADVWSLVGAFSLGWLLGLVIPGAPGGLGVFEATVLAVLTPQFPAAIVLGVVALYRLNSTLAEVLAAGLAVLDERWNAAIERRANAPVVMEEEETPSLPQLPAGDR